MSKPQRYMESLGRAASGDEVLDAQAKLKLAYLKIMTFQCMLLATVSYSWQIKIFKQGITLSTSE